MRSLLELESLRDGCHATELYDACLEARCDADQLRALLVEARDALRGLEERHEPGVFCDHASAPCSRCSKAYAVLARIEAEVGAK